MKVNCNVFAPTGVDTLSWQREWQMERSEQETGRCVWELQALGIPERHKTNKERLQKFATDSRARLWNEASSCRWKSAVSRLET